MTTRTPMHRTILTIPQLTDTSLEELTAIIGNTRDHDLREFLHDLHHILSAGPDDDPLHSERGLSPNAVAEILGVSRTYVNKLIAEGHLAMHKVGTHKRISPASVERILDERNRARKQLAEDTAHKREIESDAIDELAGNLATSTHAGPAGKEFHG